MSVESTFALQKSRRDDISVEEERMLLFDIKYFLYLCNKLKIVIMANTYTQIHIHGIFAVKYRDAVISKLWQEDLYKYITGIIQNKGHKLLSIGGVSDHIHLLFGMRPTQSLSELMQMVKNNSSKWINDKKLVRGYFSWQEGFSAFSYSKSQIHQVCNYIENQEQHHAKITFLDEYKEFLKLFDINYDELYLFKPVE
jgi:REP element-mobilizing transposase RayT